MSYTKRTENTGEAEQNLSKFDDLKVRSHMLSYRKRITTKLEVGFFIYKNVTANIMTIIKILILIIITL